MKERILLSLEKCAQIDRYSSDPLVTQIEKEMGLEKSVLERRATRALKQILHDYSYFAISTIDKFTLSIIKTFSRDLQLPYQFEVELDTDKILQKAVDNVLEEAGENQKLTKYFLGFMNSKIDDQKSWDLSYDLNENAKVLLKEESIAHLPLLEELSIEKASQIHSTLIERTQNFSKSISAIAKESWNLIVENQIPKHAFYQKAAIASYFHLLAQEKFDKVLPNSHVKNTIEKSKWTSIKATDSEKKAILSISFHLRRDYLKIQEIIKKKYPQFILDQLVLKNLNSFGLLSEVQKKMHLLQKEERIVLISDFNRLIFNEIKNNPTPFIYERLGQRYRYFFIDEFQDTSEYQFENIKPLIEDSLSRWEDDKSKAILVGDPKQAIYRWRGGKAELFLSLAHNSNNKNTQLPTNYRSREVIVSFLNKFFTYNAQQLTNLSYKEAYEMGSSQLNCGKKGGYVQINCLDPKLENLKEKKCEWLLSNIKTCIQLGYNYQDITILARKNKEIVEIAQLLSQHKIPVISSDSLLLNKSKKAQTLIAALRWIDEYSISNTIDFFEQLIQSSVLDISPQDEFLFLMSLKDKSQLECFKILGEYGLKFDLSLFNQNLVQTLFNLTLMFQFNKHPNTFVQFLMYEAHEFVARKNDKFHSFLDYWDAKKEELALSNPQGINAVQIMTIHKSKGLEFPIVFIPFADWNPIGKGTYYTWISLDKKNYPGLSTLHVRLSKDLELAGEYYKKRYEELTEFAKFDAMNLLYVALSRAKDQLFICTDDSSKMICGWFQSFVESQTFIESQNAHFIEYGTQNRKELSAPTSIKTLDYFGESYWESKLKIASDDSINSNTHRAKAREEGNKIHQIMSMVSDIESLDFAIDQSIFKGIIRQDEKKTYLNMIKQVVEHTELKKFYHSPYKVRNESDILTSNGKRLRPDRLVFSNEKTVSILDYKTGSYHSFYDEQLNQYEKTLINSGFSVEFKLLVFLNESISVFSVS